MQAAITFTENTIRTKTANRWKAFAITNPLQALRRFVEESDWDERLLGYEKQINRFSWGIIIVSVIFLTPVCINIFSR